MKKLLALCTVMVLGFGSIAIAGGISSADANFLFGNDQIVAATISDTEMEQTQGQLAIILPPAPVNLISPLSLEVLLLERSTVLGVNVKSDLFKKGIAYPLVDLVQTLPLDPSMLTDLLEGGGLPLDPSILTGLLGSGVPLDTSMLTDLLGGGLLLDPNTLIGIVPLDTSALTGALDLNALTGLIGVLPL